MLRLTKRPSQFFQWIKTSLKKNWRNYVFNTRFYYRIFLVKIRRPFYIFAILFFFVFLAAIIYGINILLGLIYDEEVAKLIDKKLLFVFLLVPATTLYINIILLVKMIWDRILRSPGTLLRFKVIGFFFFSIVIPGVFFIYVFDIFFDKSIAIFDNQAIMRTMKGKLWSLTRQIELTKSRLESNFDFQKSKNFTSSFYSEIDYWAIYNEDQKIIQHYEKNNLKLNPIPQYNFSIFLPGNDRRFASYNQEKGYVYLLLKEINQGKVKYFFALRKVDDNLKEDIQETVRVIREVKQFELLIYPFKVFSIFFLVYVYTQVFSILAIFFYYRSNRYISPIAELIRSTQKIAQGNYKLSLNSYIKHMGNNEIKELLESFVKMSRELIRNRQHAERVSTIMAWKDVARKLAHEVKNPLTPIVLTANQIENKIMKKDLVVYNEVKEDFDFILREIDRIKVLLNEFNILAKQEVVKFEYFSLDVVFEQIIKVLKKYPSIVYTVDNQWPFKIYADQEKLFQVFLNLIQNSIESLVEVDLNQGEEPTIKILVYPAEKGSQEKSSNFETLFLEVWDNGVGISPEKKSEIFKPYVTFKKKGTGLGLSICEEIISLHQGKIEFLIQEDPETSQKWTIFRISLPIQGDKT